MTDPWIDEGIRQFRLAVLWARSVRPAESPDGAQQAKALFRRVRDEVVKPSLRHEWIPGVGDQYQQFHQYTHDKKIGGDEVVRLLGLVESRFLAAFGEPPYQPPSTRGKSQLGLAFRWAVDAALGIEGVGSKGSGWGNLGDPTAWRPTPREQAAAWLSQGVALAAWETLRWEVDFEAESSANVRRVPALADDCRRIRAWLLEPSTVAGALGDDAAAALDQCARALDRLRETARWPEGDDRPIRDPKGPLRAIDEEIERGSWVPRLIAKFQKALGKLDAATLSKVLGDAEARAVPNDEAEPAHLVLLALADRLADLSLTADHPAWDELERLGKRLLDDPAESIEIIRVPRDDLSHCDEVLADGQPPRIITPGLVVLKGAKPRIVRHARVETPRRRPHAPLLCRRLAGSIRARDLELAELFDQVATDLACWPDLAAAWSAIRDEPEKLGRFWQAIQRAAALELENVPAAADFLAELGKTFQFVAPTGHRPSRDGWRIARDGDAREAGPLNGVPRLALKGPDGMVVEPTGWIRVPKSWDSPLLRELEAIQPLIDGLRALDPGWTDWADADSLPWDVAYRGGGETPGPIDPASARAAFLAVYERSQRADDPLASAFQRLARALHAGLVDSGAVFSPRLDRETLRPVQVTPGTRIRWASGPAPAGTMLRVVQFGVGEPPGEVEMSLGPDPSPEVLAWADWLQRGDGAAVPGLGDWRSELPELLGQPEKLSARSQEFGKRFRQWARSREGREGFHRLVSQASTDASADSLLKAILAAEWAEVWPRIGPDGLAVWPDGLSSRTVPDATWAEAPDVPLGRSKPGRFRYAIAPELVAGEFSLGTLPPSSPIAGALELFQAADRGGFADDVVRNVLHDEIDSALDLAGGPPPGSNLAVLLDAIVAASRSRSMPAEALDAILGAARRWAGSRGRSILPGTWSFANPPESGKLAGEGVAVSAVLFLEGSEAGQVRLGSLGFSGEGGRPPKLATSAGPPPSRYAELCKLVHAARTDWPDAGRLSDELAEWPAARLDGDDALRFAAERFFGSFWDLVGPPPRSAAAETIGQTLAQLLAENFDLTTFEPVSLRDFGREWVTVNEYGPGKSHRVKRLIRPGLRTPTDVSYPAVVDVE